MFYIKIYTLVQAFYNILDNIPKWKIFKSGFI